jgi:hypothetical protein
MALRLLTLVLTLSIVGDARADFRAETTVRARLRRSPPTGPATRFAWSIPARYRNGAKHGIEAWITSSSQRVKLPGSPKTFVLSRRLLDDLEDQ